MRISLDIGNSWEVKDIDVQQCKPIAGGAKDVIAAKHETAEGSVDRFLGSIQGKGVFSHPGTTTAFLLGEGRGKGVK